MHKIRTKVSILLVLEKQRILVYYNPYSHEVTHFMTTSVLPKLLGETGNVYVNIGM